MTTFQIKLALLGHVSVGKTTILNALLQDKYSEVKKTRTTAAVNCFYLSSPLSVASSAVKDNVDNINIDTSSETAAAAAATATTAVNTAAEAEAVLEQITSANKRWRSSSTSVEELSFHVEIPEPLCDMRDDTQLVVIDIPGLNEQGSREKYTTYVSHRWKTWDCAVLVMDATQGVNSQEQVELLETMKSHFDTKKKIPILILCNKYDNPDEEDEAIIDEVRKKVESIFKVTCRSQALEKLLLSNPDGRGSCCGGGRKEDGNDVDLSSQRSFYPAVIPIAAAKAFLYRAVSRMTLEQFQQERLRQRFNIEELVRDEVGRAHKDAPEERYKLAYQVISDPLQYQERLATTNFDKFLTVLARSVGSTHVQRQLIHKQLLVELDDITLEEFLVSKVQAIADKHKILGNPSGHIRARFWVLFGAFLENAFKMYRQDLDLSGLSTASDLLSKYMKLSDTLTPTRHEEARDVFQAFVRIFRYQCQVIREKVMAWSINEAAFMDRWTKVGTSWLHHGTGKTVQVQGKNSGPPSDSPFHWERTSKGWKNKYTKVEVNTPGNPAKTKATWQNLSPHDWNMIISSVLLPSCSSQFVDCFGREKTRLEFLLRHGCFTTYFNTAFCVNCASELEKKAHNDLAIYTEWKYQSGKLIPAHPTGYMSVFQIPQPASLSDPRHWGHVGWRVNCFANCHSFSTEEIAEDEDYLLESETVTVVLPSQEDDLAEQGDY